MARKRVTKTPAPAYGGPARRTRGAANARVDTNDQDAPQVPVKRTAPGPEPENNGTEPKPKRRKGQKEDTEQSKDAEQEHEATATPASADNGQNNDDEAGQEVGPDTGVTSQSTPKKRGKHVKFPADTKADDAAGSKQGDPAADLSGDQTKGDQSRKDQAKENQTRNDQGRADNILSSDSKPGETTRDEWLFVGTPARRVKGGKRAGSENGPADRQQGTRAPLLNSQIWGPERYARQVRAFLRDQRPMPDGWAINRGEKIDEGGQGQVFRATYNLGLPDERRGVVKSTLVRSDDGAAYIYDYRTTRKRRRDGLLESEAAVREIEFLQQLKAARRERENHIVEYFFHATYPHNILLFMEEMNGNAEVLLNQNLACDPHKATPTTAITAWQLRSKILFQLWEQLLTGLSFLHEQEIAHQDLKPANVLWRQIPRSSNFLFKIADFGMSLKFGDNLHRGDGTHCYTPPQQTVFPRADPDNSELTWTWKAPGASLEKYAQTVHGGQDMWSAFCMMFYCFDRNNYQTLYDMYYNQERAIPADGGPPHPSTPWIYTPKYDIPYACHAPDALTASELDFFGWLKILYSTSECEPILRPFASMLGMEPSLRMTAPQALRLIQNDRQRYDWSSWYPPSARDFAQSAFKPPPMQKMQPVYYVPASPDNGPPPAGPAGGPQPPPPPLSRPQPSLHARQYAQGQRVQEQEDAWGFRAGNVRRETPGDVADRRGNQQSQNGRATLERIVHLHPLLQDREQGPPCY